MLGLSIDHPLTDGDRKEICTTAETSRKYELFEAWRHNFISKLKEAYRIGHSALIHCTDLDSLSEQEVAAMQMQECILYWSDLLSTGSLSEQLQIYKDREVIAKWIKKILQS